MEVFLFGNRITNDAFRKYKKHVTATDKSIEEKISLVMKVNTCFNYVLLMLR